VKDVRGQNVVVETVTGGTLFLPQANLELEH